MTLLESAIRDIVERVFPRLAYLGSFPCTVKSQNPDGTLELVPDDTDLGAHSKVKVRHGLPAMVIKVQSGGRVMLAFEHGDPARPYAWLWDYDSAKVTEMTVNGQKLILNAAQQLELKGPLGVTINGGTTPVAKEGSALLGVAGPYALSGVVQPGAGSPLVKVP